MEQCHEYLLLRAEGGEAGQRGRVVIQQVPEGDVVVLDGVALDEAVVRCVLGMHLWQQRGHL